VATPPAPWPAAQSERSAGLLAAARRRAAVLAAFPAALYLQVDDTVLPVVARTGLRLPTALLVTPPGPLVGWGVQPGDAVVVGAGAVELPHARLVVRRTWRPARMPSGTIPGPVPSPYAHGAWQVAARDLAAAALAGQPVHDAAATFVGAGPGLTPSGDDVLCGVLLGLRLAGEPSAAELVWHSVLPLLGRTTTLSGSLLREAADGYAVPDLVRLGAALAAGDLPGADAAAERVLAIGHTSGSDLLGGLWGALEATGTTITSPNSAAPAAGSEGVCR
jgi:hypothetical protein